MKQVFDQLNFHGSLPAILCAKGLRQASGTATLAAAIALCCGGAALAEETQGHHAADSGGHQVSHSAFSYNYAEMRYIDITVDEGGHDLDGDGFEFKGSFGLGDRFQVTALYETIGFDDEIDLSEWAVGFGTHYSVAVGTDFVAQLAYISEEITQPHHAPHSDDGYQLGLGVRQKLGERGEIQFGVDFTEFSQAGSITSFELVGEMHVLPALAIGFGVNTSDHATAYFAEARFYFGGH